MLVRRRRKCKKKIGSMIDNLLLLKPSVIGNPLQRCNDFDLSCLNCCCSRYSHRCYYHSNWPNSTLYQCSIFPLTWQRKTFIWYPTQLSVFGNRLKTHHRKSTLYDFPDPYTRTRIISLFFLLSKILCNPMNRACVCSAIFSTRISLKPRNWL